MKKRKTAKQAIPTKAAAIPGAVPSEFYSFCSRLVSYYCCCCCCSRVRFLTFKQRKEEDQSQRQPVSDSSSLCLFSFSHLVTPSVALLLVPHCSLLVLSLLCSSSLNSLLVSLDNTVKRYPKYRETPSPSISPSLSPTPSSSESESESESEYSGSESSSYGYSTSPSPSPRTTASINTILKKIEDVHQVKKHQTRLKYCRLLMSNHNRPNRIHKNE